jgi:deoxyribose-phosphate aldolase
MAFDLAQLDFDLAPYIEHALLDPCATAEQLAQACSEADRYGFATVCISPCWVQQASELLHNREPRICSVIGFPSGATTPASKRFEAEEAVEHGADELDVMINLGWLKSGQTNALNRELTDIVEATGKPIKAILEVNRLAPDEVELAVEVCLDAGVQYLKTGTGWAGAVSVASVKRLKSLSRGRVGIKAAGGIHTPGQAAELILAGATRLGTSRGVALIQALEQDQPARPGGAPA